MNTALIYPMFALVALTFTVLLVLFISRVQGVRMGAVKWSYFKNFSATAGEPTELMGKASRHFSNLFEMPVLFYAGCVVAMVLPMESTWALNWAWIFVGARALHAFIHLGSNKVRPRALSYAIGCAAIMGLWITIILNTPSI